MSLSQLFLCRPVTPAADSPAALSPFTPVPGLLLCGAGAHPGGGVLGAPGQLAAQAARALARGSSGQQARRARSPPAAPLLPSLEVGLGAGSGRAGTGLRLPSTGLKDVSEASDAGGGGGGAPGGGLKSAVKL
ncbi:hypothetical protein FOCC_FOCC013900 [Frankliniella occidentalis]|nr:hypothetical protein FOCC_FOCC013900 [Frankliniella occidentalis]